MSPDLGLVAQRGQELSGLGWSLVLVVKHGLLTWHVGLRGARDFTALSEDSNY